MKKPAIIMAFATACLVCLFSESFPQQEVFKIKVEAKTERDVLVFREIGLDCAGMGECICQASLSQLNELRRSHYSYTPIKQGMIIEAPPRASISGSNGTNYYIHDHDTTYSTITISGAPECALVEGMEVRYDIIHSWVEDLTVELLHEEEFWAYTLWHQQGEGDTAIHDTVSNISFFDGEDVNQTWKLRVSDAFYGDTGYIDYWKVTIWYQGPADLIVQSLTPSNYNPTAGEQINVTMTIKNQGDEPADACWADLFFDEPSPPTPPTDGDVWWRTSELDPGETETHTFMGITNWMAQTWHMYGLVDSYNSVVEINENNNVKGPVLVMWHEAPLQPDLVIQSLTASDYYPTVGEEISVTLVMENLGTQDAGFFWADLFLNLSSPPTVPSTGDDYCRKSLPAGTVDSCTFSGITCASPGTWNMYGLIDSEDEVSEGNEDNNVRGPVDVHWQSAQQGPDLIVDDFCIANIDPEIGDLVHVMITVKNEGDATAYGFFSSLFYDRPTPPAPQDLGDDYFYYSILGPGESYTHSFYISNDQAEYWDMYFLVDSWGSVDESDENNNLYGPEYVTWSYPAKPGPITRNSIMATAGQYANVEWVCGARNADAYSECSSWVCDYMVDSTYQGVPYLWGGSRRVTTFQNELANGYCAGAHRENDCLTGDPGLIGDVCWATGIDCSGFVFRCWGMPKWGGTLTLLSDTISSVIRYDQLMKGDALDDTTSGRRHVVLFYRGVSALEYEVYEARSYGVPPPHPDSNLVRVRRYRIDYFDRNNYLPIRRINIVGDPPLISGDCNDDDVVDVSDIVFLVAYLYQEGAPPNPLCAGNVNGDDVVNVGDPVYLVTYLYKGGPAPQNGCD